MEKPLRALIIEDSEDDAALLVRELRRGGYEAAFERVETPEAMTAALDRQTWEIVFADYTMPGFSGAAALKILRERDPDLPFIFVSATIGEDTAVEAMLAGANDYIMKGNLKRLVPAVQRELREAKMRQEHAQAEKMIQHMAFYDLLTHLPNRNMIYDRLLNAIRTGGYEGKPVALLLLDLDRFKEINDTLGHHRGDILLQQVGPRLKDALRPSDMVARLGGDEFAVVLPLAGSEDAALVAQKIQKALEPPFMIEDLPIAVEVSIGVAIYPDHGENPDSLFQRADVAMYMAKKTGSGHAVYSPDQDQHSPRRLALMGELRHAIENNQLLLHYQPKISLKTGAITGVEALVRWRHPEQGLVPPDQFIGSAERTGLILPLTRWVFDQAQRQCLLWRRAGKDLTTSINISARSLHDKTLPDQLQELIRECGGTGDRLELEITEGTIMADPIRALEIMRRLKAIGIRFSIDDFGIGYSSLSYLKRLPVDEIKIDKSFVIGMTTDENDAVIVRSTIDLAHNLGLQVVAEGVENKEVWDRLSDLGCDAAQGYYMCRPIPATELTRWLSESPWGLKKN